VSRFGGFDGDVALSGVNAVAVHPEGDLYLTDFGAASVTVLTEGSARVRTIGRPGEGPGEFRATHELGFTGDTLWVVDRGRATLQRFLRDGTFLESVAVPAPADPGTGCVPRPTHWLATNEMALLTACSDRFVAENADARLPLFRAGPDGRVRDTLGWVPAAAGRLVAIRTGDVSAYLHLPDLGPVGHALAPDGTALALLAVREAGPRELGIEAVWVDPTGARSASSGGPSRGAPSPPSAGNGSATTCGGWRTSSPCPRTPSCVTRRRSSHGPRTSHPSRRPGWRRTTASG